MRGFVFCIHTNVTAAFPFDERVDGSQAMACASLHSPGHAHCPRLLPYTRCSGGLRGLLCASGCLACGGQCAVWPGMRNGGLPSVALLPSPQQKASSLCLRLCLPITTLLPSTTTTHTARQRRRPCCQGRTDWTAQAARPQALLPSRMHGRRRRQIMAASSSRPPNSLTLATTHHPPPPHSTDIMSSKRGRGGTTGAKFRMTLGLPVAAVINCAGEWSGCWVWGGVWWRREWM